MQNYIPTDSRPHAENVESLRSLCTFLCVLYFVIS